jgi:hypothetical protein
MTNKITPPRGQRSHFVRIGFMMSPEERKNLKILAIKLGMDFSEIIREACSEYSKKHEM